MFVSVESITIVLSAIGVVLSLGASIFGGLAWVVRRIDSVEGRLSGRIDSVEERLSGRIDSVEERLGGRIDSLATEVTELKIAVARLEGPQRHLYTSGR
ncbi:hypothetical protein [Microbacterium natoriense]